MNSETDLQIQAGTVFYDNDWKYKCYVVCVLLEEKIPQVVYRYFGKRKQWWHYEIISLSFFQMNIEIGTWTFKKMKKANKVKDA